jgi:hypothetical protein
VAVTANAAGGHGLLRAAALATVSAVLTALGHLAGGGALPDLVVLVVLLPLLAGAFTMLAERSAGVLGTLAALGVGQLVLHQLIELLNPAHHAHHAVASSDTRMVAMHAAATAITAVALRYADRAIAALGAALRRVRPRRPQPLRADRPLATLATPGPAVSLRLARALAAVQVRRGPPVGC